jgi:two-component system chemotaxis response regulator CheB
MMRKKIRVLIVDDSALVRQILSAGLSREPDIEVVGVAHDPYMARDKILATDPDVLTLDVEMPRMDGIEFLRRLMPQYPLPVVMVSALTEKGKQITLDALEAGAVDFVTKPNADMVNGLNQLLSGLTEKIRIAAGANMSRWKRKDADSKTQRAEYDRMVKSVKALAVSTDKVIAIGASTGGTEAIRELVCGLPASMPGVVIVQHMPAGFTRMFSERLNSLCAMEVREAKDGDRIMNGRVLIAPGGLQLRVVRSGGIYQVRCFSGELVSGHCPSVNVMMSSVAKAAGANAIGVMLTGMGADGADGLLSMRQAGARTLAQSEKTCVVFGMPKEAYKKGGVEKLVDLPEMATQIISLYMEMNK